MQSLSYLDCLIDGRIAISPDCETLKNKIECNGIANSDPRTILKSNQNLIMVFQNLIGID